MASMAIRPTAGAASRCIGSIVIKQILYGMASMAIRPTVEVARDLDGSRLRVNLNKVLFLLAGN